MSATLLRLGLWVTLLAIVAYVIHETFSDQFIAEVVPVGVMQKALALGVILAIAGLITRLFEKGARAVVKNRCVVCRAAIPPGAIYCRAHLRAVLHREEDLSHTARGKRG
jgi:ascorbate-specific PTS system EIIC-type component UlaA